MEIDEGKGAAVLQEYRERLRDNEAFVAEIQRLIGTLVQSSGVAVVSITGRVKTVHSLERKLLKPTRRYETLDDITDICGIRIITYFADDVDILAKLVREEFEIDLGNSVDKRTGGDPDRFGYVSLHYIAKLNDQRCSLRENRRFTDHRFELQIRSILQHAWAEIEHDLGYKSENELPRQFRRQFSRLAGLLELADEQFGGIRRGLNEYANSLAGEIKNRPQSVPIDSTSVTQLLETDVDVKKLEQEFGCAADGHADNGVVSILVRAATGASLTSINELQELVRQHRSMIEKLAAKMRASSVAASPRGLSLYWAILAHAKSRGFLAAVAQSILPESTASDDLIRSWESLMTESVLTGKP